jgi:hypothetical protein
MSIGLVDSVDRNHERSFVGQKRFRGWGRNQEKLRLGRWILEARSSYPAFSQRNPTALSTVTLRSSLFDVRQDPTQRIEQYLTQKVVAFGADDAPPPSFVEHGHLVDQTRSGLQQIAPREPRMAQRIRQK